MIAVVQRVKSASVTVAETGYHAAINKGLLILLGVEKNDEISSAKWLAGKCARLRIFADENDNMNLSVKDIAGQVLVVSQFTLTGNCRKGNRPGFDKAAPPEIAKSLYENFIAFLRDDHSLPTQTGVFQAMMDVHLVNSGPVTLILKHPQ